MSFNSIIREFQRRGIGNDDEIAEYISHLLVTFHEDPTPWARLNSTDPDEVEQAFNELRGLDVVIAYDAPQLFPEEMWRDGLRGIWRPLNELLEENRDDLGQFYQQQVRFHLLRSSQGERYPTPHHICDFLVQLILPAEPLSDGDSKKIFDPTMGTGGLLVAAHRLQPELQLFGCDYNERWTRLAFSNLYLNGVRSPSLHAQSAQRFQGFDFTYRPIARNQFDYVLMNPPFDSGVVTELLALAIDSLNRTGKAALLSPPSVVQRSDHQIGFLNYLQAVISLPPDALRPYSGIRSHILLIDKASRDSEIWLCDLQSDGYGTGTARPLNFPVYPQASELPRSLKLFQLQRQTEWPLSLPFGNGISLLAVSLTAEAIGERQHPGGLAAKLTGGNSQPTSWGAYHFTDGAVLWWGQSALRETEHFVFANYDSETPIALQRSHTQRMQWREQIQATSAAPIASAWKTPETKIELTWQADTLTLNPGKASEQLIYQLGDTADIQLCILNDDGQVISGWYGGTLTEAIEAAMDKEAQQLDDATGISAGWLLPLTTDDRAVQLLLVKSTSVELFVAQNNEGHYGLLRQAASGEQEDQVETGGVWRLKDGQLTLHSGPRVNTTLPQDRKSLGIAFGPQVGDASKAIVFGVCLAREALNGQTLEPERYLPETRPTAVQQRPAEILAQIRQKQRAMDSRVDTLLSALGHGTSQTEHSESFPPLNLPLNPEQSQLWESLTQQQDPYLFESQIQQLATQNRHFSAPEVLQQIDLLVSLGLLLPVTIDGQNQYRCLRLSDLIPANKNEN